MASFWKRCLLGILSALLLNLPFPIAGPVPAWRTAFAFFGLVPLFVALLSSESVRTSLYLGKSFLVGWITGILWYGFNCYWIYQTMFYYGGLPPAISALILVLFSLILGLYFALFSWLVALSRNALGTRVTLVLIPFLWVAVDWLASLVTKVPWDQLGYSQVGNFLLTRLAPVTGVYGVTFVVVCLNVVLLCAFLVHRHPWQLAWMAVWLAASALCYSGYAMMPPASPVSATAVLLQENLSVNTSNQWIGPEWDQNVSLYLDASQRTCGPYIAGMPETSAPLVHPDCRDQVEKPDIVAWPEAPSPFHEGDPRFQQVAASLGKVTHAPAIIGNLVIEYNPQAVSPVTTINLYNSASFMAPDGRFVGRYNKIHLVPWGEYVPFRDFFSFAGHLTRNVGSMVHGWRRDLFSTGGHKYGVFICYESIFGDEIRLFAKGGADVFVNISDDGWYGDTSAPWQHLNMARMRAIENRRWLLRDTNSGVTAIIDPHGRLTQSMPRHVFGSLAGRYGFRADKTFYTLYGNVFAMLCGIITLIALTLSGVFTMRQRRV